MSFQSFCYKLTDRKEFQRISQGKISRIVENAIWQYDAHVVTTGLVCGFPNMSVHIRNPITSGLRCCANRLMLLQQG